MYSNGVSTCKQSEDSGCAPGMRDPHWALFDAWFFPGVSLGDIRGVCEVTKAGDAVYLDQVGQGLDGLCHNWRLMYPQQHNEMYYSSLRKIIGEGLACECWVEIFAGRPKVVYHGNDVYWKTWLEFCKRPEIRGRIQS